MRGGRRRWSGGQGGRDRQKDLAGQKAMRGRRRNQRVKVKKMRREDGRREGRRLEKEIQKKERKKKEKEEESRVVKTREHHNRCLMKCKSMAI